MPLYVKRLTETAQLPTRATEYAAGLDLYADDWNPRLSPTPPVPDGRLR